MQEDKLLVPPSNTEVEYSILGGCMLDPRAVQEARILKPEDFYDERAKELFKAIQAIDKKNEAVDMVTVLTYLKEHDKAEQLGGVTFLKELVETVPYTGNTKYYAKIVKSLSIRRKMIQIGAQISEKAFQEEDTSLLLHEANELLDQMDTGIKISTGADEIMNILNTINNMGEGIPLPIRGMDFIKINGGDLVLIEAPTKNGKTTVAMNIALDFLIKKYKVGVATFEVPMKERYIPLISSAYVKKLPFDKTETLKQVTAFLTDFGESFYMIPQNTYLEDFETIILDQIKKNHIKFIFVDYDQLVKTRKDYQSEERRVSAIARTLHGVAVKGDCIVVLLSQVNKEGTGRWSGEKENEAAVVIRIEKDPVLDELKIWAPYNRYGRNIPSSDAVVVKIDWNTRRIE